MPLTVRFPARMGFTSGDPVEDAVIVMFALPEEKEDDCTRMNVEFPAAIAHVPFAVRLACCVHVCEFRF